MEEDVELSWIEKLQLQIRWSKFEETPQFPCFHLDPSKESNSWKYKVMRETLIVISDPNFNSILI